MTGRRGALVRRWGGRAVGLTITAIGLYVVLPSLLTMFAAWPQLSTVDVPWFFVLLALQVGRLVSLWWLTKLALAPAVGLGWGTTATAQLAGSAAAKVVPGGGAVGGVVQARILIGAGQPSGTVASGLGAIALLQNAVLFLLPVLTVPALLIGPPPAKQLQLGLVVSVVLAIVIVTIGVTALTWPAVLRTTGRGIGRLVHVVRRGVTPESVAGGLLAQRERIVDGFHGRWLRAVFATAATRMFDYASLVAALVAFDVHARPSEVLLAFVVSQALAIVPITPGGVGFVDLGLTGMLVLIGVPAETAVVATLLYRLFSFWLPIPLGLFAWTGWRISRHYSRSMTVPAGVDPTIPPSGTGCVECDAAGGWWVHLRRCTQCGHIGCCDTSPMQHATAHWRESGHPVITSFEPGEDWFWDYTTESGFLGPTMCPPTEHPLDQPVPGPAGRVPDDWRDHIHE